MKVELDVGVVCIAECGCWYCRIEGGVGVEVMAVLAAGLVRIGCVGGVRVRVGIGCFGAFH